MILKIAKSFHVAICFSNKIISSFRKGLDSLPYVSAISSFPKSVGSGKLTGTENPVYEKGGLGIKHGRVLVAECNV